MPDQRTDRIAHEAARLLDTGRMHDVAEAIRAAADGLGCGDAPRPGPGRVRRHVRGMQLQALGDREYEASIGRVLRVAEEVMTVIEETLAPATTLLVGRAAAGLIDAGVTIHVRVYTDRPLRDVVEILVERGYDEPAFETADTRVGRLDRIRFTEDDQAVVVTRCPSEVARQAGDRGRDLFRGRPIEVATLDALRRRLADDPHRA